MNLEFPLVMIVKSIVICIITILYTLIENIFSPQDMFLSIIIKQITIYYRLLKKLSKEHVNYSKLKYDVTTMNHTREL